MTQNNFLWPDGTQTPVPEFYSKPQNTWTEEEIAQAVEHQEKSLRLNASARRTLSGQ